MSMTSIMRLPLRQTPHTFLTPLSNLFLPTRTLTTVTQKVKINTIIKIPNLGDVDSSGLTPSGRVVKWHVTPGQVYKAGYTICDVEIKDMFVMGLDMEDGGEVDVLLVEDGEESEWLAAGKDICKVWEEEDREVEVEEGEVSDSEKKS